MSNCVVTIGEAAGVRGGGRRRAEEGALVHITLVSILLSYVILHHIVTMRVMVCYAISYCNNMRSIAGARLVSSCAL